MKTSNGNILIVNYHEYIELLSDNNMKLVNRIENFTQSKIILKSGIMSNAVRHLPEKIRVQKRNI